MSNAEMTKVGGESFSKLKGHKKFAFIIAVVFLYILKYYKKLRESGDRISAKIRCFALIGQ